jgi:hypothetical protein
MKQFMTRNPAYALPRKPTVAVVGGVGVIARSLIALPPRALHRTRIRQAQRMRCEFPASSPYIKARAAINGASHIATRIRAQVVF